MKKLTIILVLILIASKGFTQLNTGLNFNYVREYNPPKPGLYKGWGYNILLGYTFKRKLDVNLKIEHSRWGWSAFSEPTFFTVNSAQFEFKYYLVGIKREVNPYVSIAPGFFEKKEGILLGGNGNTKRTAMGILSSVGALFKLQAKENRLYLDTKLSYSYVDYKFYPANSISFNVGILFYFKATSLIPQSTD